jgi:starch synthase (maltosyl-transferring)
LRFYDAFSDDIVLYGKRHPADDDLILVAVNLDPHEVREADIEVPLWEWNLPDHAALMVQDLVQGRGFTWIGKRQRIRLDPADLPYAIWRVAPIGDA